MPLSSFKAVFFDVGGTLISVHPSVGDVYAKHARAFGFSGTADQLNKAFHSQWKKMGGIEGIMSFMPGVSKIKSQMDSAGIDESIITKNEAIILSMTKKEKENPKIIDGSRKKRIANGSGTDPATINKLLKQFKMMSEMMKKMSKGNLKGMTDKGIPPELFNQLK